MIVFGIDPGVTGAVAALENGELMGVRDLPIAGVPGAAVRWVEPGVLTHILRDLAGTASAGRKPMTAFVERIHFSRQGGNLTAPTIFGSVLATLQMWGCAFTIVEALQWKRHAGLVAAASSGADRKAASLAKARQLFPTCDELERKMDHNRAEALLIARYGASLKRSQVKVA